MFYKAEIKTILLILAVFILFILNSNQSFAATCVNNACSDGRGPCRTDADCGGAPPPAPGLCRNGACTNQLKSCKIDSDCLGGENACVAGECKNGSGQCRTEADCGGAASPGKPFSKPTQPKIPTEGLPGFGQLIEMIFTWSLSILGIIVFVMIFYAGFKWFTAAGNTARVNEARGQITNAITGAIILLAAYIILYTVNPDLVGGKFTLPGLGTSPTGGGGGGGGGGTGVCRNPGGTANYAGDLRGAIDAVIAINPGSIADAPNTTANSLKFLNYVAAELQSAGFSATTNVLNGNDRPNSGDLIAVWQSGDSTVERYDAVIDAGVGNKSMKDAATTDYTGDIPLSCAS